MFTTQPRSRTLCREIAADATIAVALLRKVTVNIARPCTIVSRPYSVLVTQQKGPPSAWAMGSNPEDVDSRPAATGILKRMVKSGSPRLMKSSSYHDLRSASSINKELPPLPPPSPTSPAAYTETKTLQTRMSIGFPKRPRSACAPDEHPSLAEHAALPDGLYKGKIHLDPQLLPSIDWAGLNVKVSHLSRFHGNNYGQVMCANHGLRSCSITLMSQCFSAKMSFVREYRSVSSDQSEHNDSCCTGFSVRSFYSCARLTFFLLSFSPHGRILYHYKLLVPPYGFQTGFIYIHSSIVPTLAFVHIRSRLRGLGPGGVLSRCNGNRDLLINAGLFTSLLII